MAVAAVIMGAAALNNMGQANAAYKRQKRAMEWSNSLKRMTDAYTNNAITTNSIWAMEDSKNKLVQTKLMYAGAAGTQAVQTAVTGFSGNTSDSVARDMQHASNLASLNIELSNWRQQQDFTEQRRNADWQMYTSLGDLSTIPKPDFLGMALQGAAAIMGSSNKGGGNKGSSDKGGSNKGGSNG